MSEERKKDKGWEVKRDGEKEIKKDRDKREIEE